MIIVIINVNININVAIIISYGKREIPGQLAWVCGRTPTYSDLYNNWAKPYGLWDLCLVIIANCNHGDREEIASLWRSIILRNVPPPHTAQALQFFRQKHSEWSILGPPAPPSLSRFEDGDWIQVVAQTIITTGRDVMGGSSGMEGRSTGAFPLSMLCSDLEQLTAIMNLATQGSEQRPKTYTHIQAAHPKFSLESRSATLILL